MGFFSRIFRVAKGKANQAVDAMEDATFETTLKQNIRDMDVQLNRIVRSSAEAMSNHNRLESDYVRWKDRADDWKAKATKALQAGNEDLAKKALTKKVECDEQVSNLQASVDQSQSARDKLKSQVDQLRKKIEAAKRNTNTLIARKNAARAQKEINSVLAGVNLNDNAFSSLSRFEESVSKDEAMAQAYEDMSDTSGADLDAEFAALDTSSADDELAKLKAELGK